MAKKYFKRTPILPNIEDWPIMQLTDRKRLIKELAIIAYRRIKTRRGKQLDKILAQTIFRERARVKEGTWRVEHNDEESFWRDMQKLLAKSADPDPDNPQKKEEVLDQILHRITDRYANEIVGGFNKKTFKFARKFLTLLFNRLLNTAANRNLQRLYGTKYELHDRLIAEGQVELLRKIFPKGNIVVVPTHFSNLDSILIGYVMDAIVGIPAFTYGAGLNLFNFGPAAYFMKRLGAYRVDRRKKNIIYLETLIALSSLFNQKGINNIFFPGGTRSRTGAIESELKMGLLSSLIDAQRELLLKGSDRKVIVVPVVMSYHFVLEAKHLINQHLRRTGQERYLPGSKPDGSRSFKRISKFVWEFFKDPSEIVVSIGRPMDVMGNFVDENAVSLDRQGNPVDIKSYFVNDGRITEDKQREAVYTRHLAARLVRRFHHENIVLTSHIVSFVAFELLRAHHHHLDLFELLRLPTDDVTLPINLMADAVIEVQDALRDLQTKGEIALMHNVLHMPLEVIYDGIVKVGKFHIAKPLAVNKAGDIYSRDFALLYYYHNRLTGYGIESRIPWRQLLASHKDIYSF